MRKRVVAAAACAFVIAGAGAAGANLVAGPVDSSGVVHACLTTAAVRGSHVVVLQDAGRACPRGTTAIQWNQTGPQGPQGLQGTAGRDGTAGKDGATVLHGAGAPPDSVGHDGDFYLDTTNTNLYGPRANGAWPTPGKSLVGPQGTPGTSGVQSFSIVGTPGVDSNKLFNTGNSYVEAFCGETAGAVLIVQNGLSPRGPGLLVTGSVTLGSVTAGSFDYDNNGGNPLPAGALAVSSSRIEFSATAGLVTGQLLVTQGNSTFTVTFSLVGGTTAACLVSAQVTPTG